MTLRFIVTAAKLNNNNTNTRKSKTNNIFMPFSADSTQLKPIDNGLQSVRVVYNKHASLIRERGASATN